MLLSLKDLPVARCFLFCFGAAAAEAAASEMWKTWAARKKNWAALFFLLFLKHKLMNFSVDWWIKVQGSSFARQVNSEHC